MTEVGTVYGEALYDLAASEALEQEILEQLKVLREGFSQEPSFVCLLASHSLSKEERSGILEDSFRGKVHVYVLNFLKILTEKGYISQVHHCVAAYQQKYFVQHNILPVTAVTAVALEDSQRARLTEKLEKLTGKTIALTNRVDSGVLGGVRLDFDGKCVDDTVAHRLQSVRHLLNNTIL